MKSKTIDCRVIFPLNKYSCTARAREYSCTARAREAPPGFQLFAVVVLLKENGIATSGKLHSSSKLKTTKGPSKTTYYS